METEIKVAAKQISAMLIRDLKTAMQEVADDITKELYDNLTGIYMYGRSEFYKRTEGFLNALIKPNVEVKGDTVTVTIGMDATAIQSNPRPTTNNRSFGEHASFDGGKTWNGISVGEALLGWWDAGTDNDIAPSLPETNYWYDVFGDRGYKASPNYSKLDQLLRNKIYEKFGRYGDIKEIY